MRDKDEELEEVDSTLDFNEFASWTSKPRREKAILKQKKNGVGIPLIVE